jgi:hypothetical protein
MRFKRIVFISLFCHPLLGWAQELNSFYEAQYKAHPAEAQSMGPKGELQWKKDRKASRYKTDLLAAWKEAEAPNFDGHYFAVHGIGCGTGCEVIFIVDWKTGRIFYPAWDASFEVRKDSRLLILNPYDQCTAYGPPVLLDFSGHRFKEIAHENCR